MKKDTEVVRVGKYEIGRMLGEGNFAKVKLARHVDSGRCFAVKILERKRVLDLRTHDQIKREIATLKLLRHPNVVRLFEVLASKTKIYMVLEYETGGELFDRIESKGRLPEPEGRKLFQQLIDAVSYCHEKGVFHRDLKPENVLLDTQGNIKISDFGLSALPQQFGHDGLLHTTCGSPNYVAPEVIANKGYDGATADIWSCGVILYVILTGCLPFDDTNLAVLYQKISKGDVQIPKWLSSGARNMIRRILDPNPQIRINMTQIKEDKWFKQDYTPVEPEEDEEDIDSDVESFSIREVPEADKLGDACHHINAFELIGMSSCLDLSGFFEEEDASSRKIRFTSNCQPEELLNKIEDIVTSMGLQVQRGHGKLKVMQNCEIKTSVKSLSAVTEVFELGPSLYVVELRKTHGDSSMYRQANAELLAKTAVGSNGRAIAGLLSSDKKIWMCVLLKRSEIYIR
ncbi:CBL-interacting serine/threonine-protein kinase 1-like isoform X1 [Zingiber officinale]|uniref:CBL-interacting serine/threonine-protein kinase 1-like isoform X1 n=1 Tax=Zingiber officinale TaxID=94328 RepID=UPI001C4B83B3|nr:CBL-interacting serine/threonine-protein kinase 1-like isoform X1 [Zingiber officinale]